jgi:hypothetical protein
MALSAIGASSTAARIEALGTTVTCSIDNLTRETESSTRSLIALSSKINAFTGALEKLQQAEQVSPVTTSEGDRFARQRESAISGGFIALKVLEQDIKTLGSTASHHDENIQVELLKKWNNAHIDKWSDILGRHTAVLVLLLERCLTL